MEVNLYVRAVGPVNTRDMEMETDITLRSVAYRHFSPLSWECLFLDRNGWIPG